MPNETQSIKLVDDTELVPLSPEEKEAVEAEIKAVLDKHDALYLPVVQEEKTLTNITTKAALFLLKKKAQEEVVSPYIENGDTTTPTEEETA